MQDFIQDVIDRLKNHYNLKSVSREHSPFVCGEYYEIAHSNCKGNCWIFKSNEFMALTLMNLTVAEEFSFAWGDIGCTYLSYYSELSADFQWHGKTMELMTEMLYTNAGMYKDGITVFAAGSLIKGMAVLLCQNQLFKYMYGEDSERKPLELSEVNGTFLFSELEPILLQLEKCPVQSNSRMAELFYNSKLNELLSIVVDKIESEEKPRISGFQINRNDSESIMYIAEHIRTNISDELNVDMLASMAKMSRAKLYYSFKSVIGMTMSEYRNLLRGKKARKLLKNTDKPIAEIAEELGFSSSSTFSRFFGEYFGMTPSKFRKMNS